MSNTINIINYAALSNLVIDHEGQPVTTSLKVAEVFGKRHDHVLRDIKQLIGRGLLPNFGEHEYEQKVGFGFRKQPMYFMDRFGFTMLVMGFTGDAAFEWKLKYAKEFDRMEAHIRNMPKFAVPQTMIEAMELALTIMKEKEALAQQNALMAPKAEVYDAVVADKDQMVHEFVRKLHGVNSNSIKKDLLFLKYLYKINAGYRVYSQYRDKYFSEKIRPDGKFDIYVTDEGKKLLAKLYNNGDLTMRANWRAAWI